MRETGYPMTTDAIGIDHLYITVADLKVSERYYDTIMPLMGFRKGHAPIGGDQHVHYYCRHYGFSLRPARSAQRHDPYRPGLHHFCFRLESVEDIDALFEKIKAKGLSVSTPKFYPEYAPDYYAIFFEDPDGIRLEATNNRAQRKRHLSDWENVT
jgi:glyoxylase I family protein